MNYFYELHEMNVYWGIFPHPTTAEILLKYNLWQNAQEVVW